MSGDLVIGDFNVDPTRSTKRDRVINGLVQSGGWRLAEVEGEWSYRGHTGNQSKLDHVLGRGDVFVETAKYVSEPFVPDFTDHAALVVDVC